MISVGKQHVDFIMNHELWFSEFFSVLALKNESFHQTIKEFCKILLLMLSELSFALKSPEKLFSGGNNKLIDSLSSFRLILAAKFGDSP